MVLNNKMKMKIEILKLLIIFLLLSSLCIALLGTGCEKEKWIELKLTDTYCTGIVNEGIGNIENHTGILISSDAITPAFVIDADEFEDVLQGRKILFPCNLSIDNSIFEGQKIIFSGELISWKGSDIDSIVGDAFSIPVILTNAKVKKE